MVSSVQASTQETSPFASKPHSTAQTPTEDAVGKYHLSQRGAYNSCFRDVWGPREKFGLNAWSPSNPEGM